MGMVAVRRFVFAGSGNIVLIQHPCNLRNLIALGRKIEDFSYYGGSFRVRLHYPISAFPVSIGTDDALVLAPLHLGILGGFCFHGHIPAVILADQILEGNVHAAGVAFVSGRIKAVAYRDEAGMEQGKHTLNEVACFQSISAKP